MLALVEVHAEVARRIIGHEQLHPRPCTKTARATSSSLFWANGSVGKNKGGDTATRTEVSVFTSASFRADLRGHALTLDAVRCGGKAYTPPCTRPPWRLPHGCVKYHRRLLLLTSAR
eukprot:scaffold12082_cov70-Phaeocystis_antarctica.AAC.3